MKAGSVESGSYVYDEIDERLIKLKDIPAIVFSETMWDLYKILIYFVDIE